eukprot:gnl/TRDRNA2_/TRDRNA2_170854_c1_seq1.p1 gnl/TRDRNA2_/TRDRNA2_170854_c1~~gnl/TRDRNA2_/TRDRNA2_170854_c1_seq1.p1  ORF type:complete len:903 (+),score=100.90 gnl/TRDRNA2_/TRDRNA2_170854_c1_seq1:207-2711(+)
MLRAAEPSIELWPPVAHRRVRNERTGALRIHIPKLHAEEPVRVTCLWQEAVEPDQWCRPGPNLLVYSSAPLAIHAHPQAIQGSPAALCSPPLSVAGRWQAAALLTGGWTPGYSSGFGNLRNPQVVVEVPHSPGRGEELQLDFYLSVPAMSSTSQAESEKDRKRPIAALTVFSRQEQLTSGPPDRLLEGQMRKELGQSKAFVGGYVTAQIVLSGAESRQPLFVVLQNSDPQESWPWQLRILARIRPRADGASGVSQSTASAKLEDAGTASSSTEVPDDPPMRCAIFGGKIGANRIYACWPEVLALYVPKPSRRDTAPGVQMPVVSWVPSRRVWGKGELLHVEASLGSLPMHADAAWQPWSLPVPATQEQESEDDSMQAAARERPGLLVSGVPKAPAIQDGERPIVANCLADPVMVAETSSTVAEARTPAPPGQRRASPRFHRRTPEVLASFPPEAPTSLPGEVAPFGAHAQPDKVARGSSEPRRVCRGASPPISQQETAEDQPSHGAAHSERHARIEAMLRRRRHLSGCSSNVREQGDGDAQALSQPPPQNRSTAFSVSNNGRGGGSCAGLGTGSGGRPPPAPWLPEARGAGTPRGRGVGTTSTVGLQDTPEEPGGALSAGLSLPPPPSSSCPTSCSGGPAVPLRHSSPTWGLPPSPRGSKASQGIVPSSPRGGPPLPPVMPPVRRNSSPLPITQEGVAIAAQGSAPLPQTDSNVNCFEVVAEQDRDRDSALQPRHLVRLERRQGADRLGFGNVAAGPKNAPVLVVSWIREGALALWNEAAPHGLKVPHQSAIVSVNGVAGDIQSMREQLREQVVELEVVAPDRWLWPKVVDLAK